MSETSSTRPSHRSARASVPAASGTPSRANAFQSQTVAMTTSSTYPFCRGLAGYTSVNSSSNPIRLSARKARSPGLRHRNANANQSQTDVSGIQRKEAECAAGLRIAFRTAATTVATL